MKGNKIIVFPYLFILFVIFNFCVIVGCTEFEGIVSEENEDSVEDDYSMENLVENGDLIGVTEFDEYDRKVEEDMMKESFEPVMPIQAGLWSSSECFTSETESDNDYYIVYWYEFSNDYKGIRYDDNGIESDEFTYEVLDDECMVFHYNNLDETVKYSFGEDGKHIVLNFNNHLEKLAWVSYGSVEDIGELGLTFRAENISPTGCDVVCEQKGGSASGKIMWDAGYSLLIYDDESKSWGTTEVFMSDTETEIEKDSTVLKHYDWSESLGALANGRYYIIFPVKDVVYQASTWNSYQYKVELMIID